MSDHSRYTFRVCETAEEIEAARRIRFEVYCVEKGWIDPATCEGGIEADDSDEQAVHFLAYKDGVPVGTTRYLVASTSDLPAAKFLPLDQFDVEPEQIAEVSRLATLRHNGRSPDLYVFIRLNLLMWEWGTQHSVKIWLAIVDVPLYHLLTRIGLPVIAAGEEVEHLGSRCVPVAFDMEGTGPALRRRLPERERQEVKT